MVLGACGTDPPTPITLPTPNGPYAVGVTPMSRFYTTAYYPAQAGTGQGHRRYASLALLHTLEVSTLPVTSNAELGALPLASATPRPVVVLSPGGASFVELSTSLAEHLASHGYVVLTVQPDAELEDGEAGLGGTHPSPALVEALRVSRLRMIADAIALLDEPSTAALVGPVDPDRIAVGGHSYGGSAAFNASLADPRIRAVFDLDGSLFEDANTTPTTVPSLVVMAFMYQLLQRPTAFGSSPDVALALSSLELLKRNEHVVAVGLRDAEHYDVTDAAAIAPALPAGIASTLGAIGPTATVTTNTLVLRFLDAALAPTPRLPSSAELVVELPSASAVTF
jgi:predicted dienelactone hydrolase